MKSWTLGWRCWQIQQSEETTEGHKTIEGGFAESYLFGGGRPNQLHTLAAINGTSGLTVSQQPRSS